MKLAIIEIGGNLACVIISSLAIIGVTLAAIFAKDDCKEQEEEYDEIRD